MRPVAKSEAYRALRTMFGPTVRIARVDAAGLTGWRVVVGDDVLAQTFDRTEAVWRMLVRYTLPLWKKRRGLVT